MTQLGPVELGLAAILLVLAGGLSVAFKLGLERSLAVAAFRMIVQLLLVGVMLGFVFSQSSWIWTLAAACGMLAIATYETTTTQHRQSNAIWQQALLGGGTLALVGALTTLYTVAAVIGNEPWYAPRLLLPLFGMILGNTLTGVNLAMSGVMDLVRREARAIEAQLSLGATRWQACSGVVRHALTTALLPTVNAMSVAGVVSLPGMMTGQILAGAPPEQAAAYQIMILSVIAGATALGAFLAAFGSVLLVTDSRHRLRRDRISFPVSGPSEA
jgi:putative ABC transport system permease protein